MVEACTLFPGLFGAAVQCLLFLTSATVLVLKKLREKSDRTWRVFMLDSSKQVLGAGFVHVLNMVLSTILGNDMEGDACDWYWMHIMLDTTLGVFLEYLWLLALIKLLVRLTGDMSSFRFGEYTDAAGRVDRIIYAKQLGVWLSCIIGMKLIVVTLLVFFLNEFVFVARMFLLAVSWNTHLKLICVMLVTPCCMNSIQFWLTDNFIQKGGISIQEVAHGCASCCTGCTGWVFHKITGKKQERRSDHLDHLPITLSVNKHDRNHHSREEDGSESNFSEVCDLSMPLLHNPFHRAPSSSASDRPSVRSDDGHRHSVHSNGGHSLNNSRGRSSLHTHPLGYIDEEHLQEAAEAFEEQRSAYQGRLEQLQGKIADLESASAHDRREKESAEAQAKANEDKMLDANEQLHKLQQDLRMHTHEKDLLRDRLAVKEEHERQLMLRVQQLEFNYSAAGAAANAVFAAEVSAASVAAASVMGRRPATQAQSPYECSDKSTIAEFLASSAAKSPGPSSARRHGGADLPGYSMGGMSSPTPS